jgi:thiol-disulfide isomerase/thioredoxin
MPLTPGSRTPRGAPSGPALLAFFDPSSRPCEVAFPIYGELAHRYGDVLPVVAVAAVGSKSQAAWLDEKGFGGPFINDEAGHRLSESFQIEAVPTVVLVEGGRVIAVSEGWDRDRVNKWDELLARYTGRHSPGPVVADHDGRPAELPGTAIDVKRTA